MKKLVRIIGVITILLTISVSVFAGSVPEDLLHEDSSKVFIGTVENYTTKERPSAPYTEIDSVEVIPTEKIKGEVEIGVKETFTRCLGLLELKPDVEYLFGWFDNNNVYIYEIESKDDKQIKLVDSNKHDQTKRLENYLNEGAFAMAEQERATLGKQISFAEFLYAKPLSDSNVEKITLRYQDGVYEVDKDEFAGIAQNMMITNVKNDALYESSEEGAYKTVLYIELLDSNEQVVSFGAVSRFGEVDKYGLFMSRLMAKDYEMETEDLLKLYSLLPEDVQNELDIPETEQPSIPKKTYTGWVIGGAAVVFVIAFAVGYTVRKTKQK